MPHGREVQKAAIEVRQLNKKAKVELAKKEAIRRQLKETELNLKKTSAILDAPQANEATLTAEGNALIESLEESLKDGDK